MAFVYAIYLNEWNIEFYLQLRGGTYVLFYRHGTTFVRKFTFSVLTSTLQLQCLTYNLNVLYNVNVQFFYKI